MTAPNCVPIEAIDILKSYYLNLNEAGSRIDVIIEDGSQLLQGIDPSCDITFAINDASSSNVQVDGNAVTVNVTEIPEIITFSITVTTSHDLVEDSILTIDGFEVSTAMPLDQYLPEIFNYLYY